MATFGVYEELDPIDDAKVETIRSFGGFLGSLARAFFDSSSSRRTEQGASAAESPCPDARPGDAPGETPCAKRARELREKAVAMRAARRR